jgi:hypothetical protein
MVLLGSVVVLFACGFIWLVFDLDDDTDNEPEKDQ